VLAMGVGTSLHISVQGTTDRSRMIVSLPDAYPRRVRDPKFSSLLSRRPSESVVNLASCELWSRPEEAERSEGQAGPAPSADPTPTCLHAESARTPTTAQSSPQAKDIRNASTWFLATSPFK
jgi:hypothetical protein